MTTPIKVSDLTPLAGAQTAPDDLLLIVDSSATESKHITRQEFQSFNAGQLTTNTKVLDLSAEWNNAVVTFTGLKFNVIDTTSNVASLLMDLQIGGTSRFKVGKGNGRMKVLGNILYLMHETSDSFSTQIKHMGNESMHFTYNSTNMLMLSGVDFTPSVQLPAAGSFGWSSTTEATQGDLRFYRDAAQTLAQRNGTNAQIFHIYNTYTDASNYERMKFGWVSNTFRIAPEYAGTGVDRSIAIGNSSWNAVYIGGDSYNTCSICVNSIGNVLFNTTGGSAAMQWVGVDTDSKLRFDPYAQLGWSQTQNDPTAALDAGIARSAAGVLKITNGSTGYGTLEATKLSIPAGASSVGGFFDTSSGYRSVTVTASTLGSPFSTFNAGIEISSSNSAYSTLAFGNVSAVGTPILRYDAVGTLAQRNGTKAQTFNIYNTYTDVSNYERGITSWLSNTLVLGTEAAGTGVHRAIQLASKYGITGETSITVDGANSKIKFRMNSSVAKMLFTSSYLGIQNTHQFGFSSSADIENTGIDAGLARSAAGILKITDGSTGYGKLTTGASIAMNYGAGATTWEATSTWTRLLNAEHTGGYQVGFMGGAVATTSSVGAGYLWQSYAGGGTTNLALVYDAVQTLAQRNGTNAQTFNIYNTYTDVSNYERGFMRWSTNELQIGWEVAGTGTANRQMTFYSAATGATLAWRFYSPNSTGNRIIFQGSDRQAVMSFDSNQIGSVGGFSTYYDYAAGAHSVHNLKSTNGNQTITYFGLDGPEAKVMQVNSGLGKGVGYGASVELWEMTTPAAPATNGVRIYAEDNGSGKTRLMALFATGAAVQIAIEP